MALAKVFSVLPRRNASEDDDDAALEGFRLALHGVGFTALVETIAALIRGEVHGLSLKWCPTPPELSKAVRDRMAVMALEVNRPKIDYTPRPFVSVEMRIDATKRRMLEENRQLLCYCDSYGASIEIARQGVRDGSIPPGSVYSGLLGAFFGPPGWSPGRVSVSPDVLEDDSGEEQTPFLDETDGNQTMEDLP